MTKPIYRSAKELGITDAEKKALLRFAKWSVKQKPNRVLKIPHDGNFRFDMNNVLTADYANDKYLELETDNMSLKELYKECGTVGCIWGGAHLMAMAQTGKSPWGRSMFRPQKYSDKLYRLFYPIDEGNWSKITPKVAGKTILHYLKTGDIEFNKFMRG